MCHGAYVGACGHAEAYLVLSGTRHGRQLHGEVVAADDVELVALQVVVARHVALQVVEERSLAYLNAFDVGIVCGEGPHIGRSVGIVGTVLADVVVHEFGHEAAGVDADTLASHLVAHVLGADKQVVDGIDYAVGDVGVVCSGFAIGKDAHAVVLFAPDGRAFEGRELSALVVVVHVFASGSELSSSVSQTREAVEVDAVGLAALVGLEQSRQAHCLVVVHDGDGGTLAGADVIAQLVVVDDQLFAADALWQEVIGDELVEHVHLVGVLRVVACALYVIEEAGLLKELADVLHRDFLGGFPQLLFPEAVGLGEEREAVEAVLRYGAHLSDRGVFGEILYASGQIEHFPCFVAIGVEGIYEVACDNQLRHDSVAAARRVRPLGDEVAHAVVAGSYDAVHLVNVSVGEHDVAVRAGDECLAVDGDAVGVVSDEDTQFAVVHVRQDELVLVEGEVLDGIGFLVAAVEDAVIDDYLLDAVQVVVAAEALP